MLNSITHNLPAKIICLLLAFGLWTYVIFGEAKVADFPNSIPLEIRNNPQNLVVVKDVDNIQVKIMADQGTWKKLSSSSFNAYVDLSGLSQGTHEVAIHVQSDVQNVQIINTKPATIMVSLEPTITKSVPVNSKVEGNAQDGMMATNIVLDPEQVDISGPQSVVSQISQVYGAIILNGENSSFTKSVSVKAYDDKDQEYKNISFNPAQIQAKVTISKAAQSKTVGIKVKTEGNVAGGYWISQISTDPISITINGSSSSLTDTNYLETKSINIDSLNSERTQSVSLDLPNGISLVDGQLSRVNVTLKVSTIDSSKEESVGFNYNGLVNNLKVNNIDPISIRVILAGPSDKLTSLDSSLVKINLDLASYNVPGTYAIDLKDTMISKPDGLTTVSFIPSSIRITLDNK